MKFSTALAALLLGALLAFSTVAMAHHGTFVSYDSAHKITMKAAMTEFRFTNPHIQFFFDVTDDQGNVVHWSAEGPDPAVWVAAGWGKKSPWRRWRRERKSQSRWVRRAMVNQ